MFKKGQRFGKWQLNNFINAGGNGEVWKAISIDDASLIVAIKLLKRINKEGYVRFRDEVKVVTENSDIQGLLQILDQNLPENPKDDTPWYVMPLAKPLKEYLDEKTPEQIVDTIILVSNILSKLHARGISHRDIKPANILVIDELIYLSDFGLVEYPCKEDITLRRKDVGPRWTIAPEMRRNPDTADGKLADVYSIAKTLWILLTKVDQGFEGQYNTGSSIEIKKYVPSIYHSPIDNIIHRCTDHEPQMRHGIDRFVYDLSKWKSLNKDFERRSKSEWVDIQKVLFPAAMPKTVIWDNIADIITVLNVISEHKQVNHTMLPSGGGLDLEGAKSSYEEGCIELNFNGQVHVVKPSKLTFECFHGNSDWNYFRLDTKGLEFIGDYEHSRDDEGLTEIEPGIYTDYECYEFDDFNGERLPVAARPVIRVAEGSFMICLRTGIYNSIPETYDGRHNKVDANEFRKYIEEGILAVNSREFESPKKEKTSSHFKKPKFVKSTKIRRGSKILNNLEIQLLDKVIALFQEARDESDKLRKDNGLDGDLSDFSDRLQYYQLPKPYKDAFRHYIKSLPDGDLALIEAVMYGGRDAFSSGRAHPLDEMLSHFKEDSRDSRIDSITGKSSLKEYLLAGINAYKGKKEGSALEKGKCFI
jgi:serine/threonine protein kinase